MPLDESHNLYPIPDYDATYTQVAISAGLTVAQIIERDTAADRIRAFGRLLNLHPELVTDSDIVAAGLRPEQWHDSPDEIDECEETGHGALMNLDKLTYDAESDIGTFFLPEDLRAWRERCGWTQVQAAAKLGISDRAFRDYENGKTPIPRMAALACWALAVSDGV